MLRAEYRPRIFTSTPAPKEKPFPTNYILAIASCDRGLAISQTCLGGRSWVAPECDDGVIPRSIKRALGNNVPIATSLDDVKEA